MLYYNRDPKRDHNFDNHPYDPYLVIPIGSDIKKFLQSCVLGLPAFAYCELKPPRVAAGSTLDTVRKGSSISRRHMWSQTRA